MTNLKINISVEEPWILAQVEGIDEFYAQGKTQKKALRNLYSVIQNIR